MRERIKVGSRANVFIYVWDFSLFSMVWFRVFLKDKHKHCGVCGRDDISGYCRRGFGERFFFSLCQGEGVKIQSSKMQIARK